MMTLFLLTGCAVKYDLVINDDLSIDEKAKLTGTEAFFANYYKTTKKNVLNSLLDQHKDYLTEKGYEYELVEDKIPYVNVSKKYHDILNYTNNSILFNDYFDEVKYTENGDIKKIETIGFNENNPDNPERFDVKELEITITLPFKVKNHNAKVVNEKTNTYTFLLDEESDYKILLEFDASKKFNPYAKTIMMILICVAIIIAAWVGVYYLNKKQK